MEKSKLPKLTAVVVGSIISLALIIIGFTVLRAGRAEDQTPRDVVVSDTTSNSAKITWATGNPTQGVVEYGVSPTALNLLAPETGVDLSHEVELTLLTPATTYYFQISIGGKKYDNAGVPWTFSTRSSDEEGFEEASPTLSLTPTPSSPEVIVSPVSTCNEITCEGIKQKLGKECTTQDYVKCIKRTSPTQAPLTTP